MGSSEKFCLRWNDFQENISFAFRELRNDSEFFDVTLACSTTDLGSGNTSSGATLADSVGKCHKTVRAHKVILSSCSIFFKDLLRTMNNSGSNMQPLIYLRGIKYEDLQSILDFMYFGEVNIAQEKLNSFLAVAEELRVKGLSPNEGSVGENSTKRPFSMNNANVSSAKKQCLVKRGKEEGGASMSHIKTELQDEHKEHFAGQGSSSKGELGGAGAQFHSPYVESYSGGDRSMDAYSEAEDYMDPINDVGGTVETGNNKSWYAADIAEENGVWICQVCGKSSIYRRSMVRHFESSHMLNDPIKCEKCGNMFANKNSYTAHYSMKHRKKDNQ